MLNVTSMKRLLLAGALLVGAVAGAAAAEQAAPAMAEPVVSEQLLREQKHFLECLAVVYHPAFWISYNGSLYFQPKDDAQARQLEVMKNARAGYAAFTDRKARHELAARALVESGVTEKWQRQLLLPYTEGNPNLTPTIPKAFRVLNQYKVLEPPRGGDALLQDGDNVYFVMDFGHGSSDGSGTNAFLVREGTKVYTTAEGEKKTITAFTSVGLSSEETTILVRVSAAFRKQAEALGRQLAELKQHRSFVESLARANDQNPFLEYQVAIAYFEGKGTEKNEPLGLEWMRKAARNGSGDAKAYLEKVGEANR